MVIIFNGITFYNRLAFNNNKDRLKVLRKLEVEALQARNYRIHEQVINEKLFILTSQ